MPATSLELTLAPPPTADGAYNAGAFYALDVSVRLGDDTPSVESLATQNRIITQITTLAYRRDDFVGDANYTYILYQPDSFYYPQPRLSPGEFRRTIIQTGFEEGIFTLSAGFSYRYETFIPGGGHGSGWQPPVTLAAATSNTIQFEFKSRTPPDEWLNLINCTYIPTIIGGGGPIGEA